MDVKLEARLLVAEVDFWSGRKAEGTAAARAVEAEAAKLGYKLLADRAQELR